MVATRGRSCGPSSVVDNDSRRVLAWTLKRRLCAEGTRELLTEAREGLAERNAKVDVMTDGGSEKLVVHQEEVDTGTTLAMEAVRLEA